MPLRSDYMEASGLDDIFLLLITLYLKFIINPLSFFMRQIRLSCHNLFCKKIRITAKENVSTTACDVCSYCYSALSPCLCNYFCLHLMKLGIQDCVLNPLSL